MLVVCFEVGSFVLDLELGGGVILSEDRVAGEIVKTGSLQLDFR